MLARLSLMAVAVPLALCGCQHDLLDVPRPHDAASEAGPDLADLGRDLPVDVVDLPQPDRPVTPDNKLPDATSQDKAPPPDTKPTLPALTDDTFADFSQGTLSESGAKIYVSARGNVQLLDRLDLNLDGHLDLVFSNRGDNAYIYWGSVKGPTTGKRAELINKGSYGNALADLNDDGYPDVVQTVYHDGVSYKCNSYIYWGAAAGYSAGNRATLPTVSARGSAVADLDRDGYLDLVFSNAHDGATYQVNSYIFWGSATGYSAVKRTELPTLTASGVSVADLDRDGQLDLVFSNQTGAKGKDHYVNSYIYWGAATGYSAAKRSELPTIGTVGNTVADLNSDGYLDVVFSSHHNGTQYLHNSYVYWGSSSGFKPTNRALLPTLGATTASAADLNSDGKLDLVFSNYHDNYKTKISSYIYWGAGKGVFTAKPSGLPTLGARGELIADFNADGYLDIAFSHYIDSTNSINQYKINAFLYWGSASGFSASSRSEYPVYSANLSTTADPGSVYDRKPVQSFTSRILDTKTAAPSYAVLSWKATVPTNTGLKLQLRSASTKQGLASAKWYGPSAAADTYVAAPGKTSAAINATHNGDRYLQYRATLSHDFGNTPVLDRVSISYQP